MAREPEPLDVTRSPELLRLVEEIEQSGQPRRLSRGNKTVAILAPVAAPRKQARPHRRTGLLGPDDPFWSLVGIGRSGLDDVSANKLQYLAKAYSPDDPIPP
jgi:hypothetical protein